MAFMPLKRLAQGVRNVVSRVGRGIRRSFRWVTEHPLVQLGVTLAAGAFTAFGLMAYYVKSKGAGAALGWLLGKGNLPAIGRSLGGPLWWLALNALR